MYLTFPKRKKYDPNKLSINRKKIWKNLQRKINFKSYTSKTIRFQQDEYTSIKYYWWEF